MRYLFIILNFLLVSPALVAQSDTLPKVIYREVYFDYNIATLSQDQKEKLNAIIDSLQKDQISKIVIIGHTDSIGSEEYNIRLSKRRVDNVRNILRENDIPVTKIAADYEGERRPAAGNTDDMGRARNRRVELAIQLYRAAPPKPPVTGDIKKGIIYGKITDANTGAPVKAALELLGDDERLQVTSAESGDYSMDYNEVTRYLIEANAPGYMYTTRNFTTGSLKDSVRVNIELMPLEVGKRFEAENIYFEPSLPDVVTTSFPEMDKLLRLMQQNPGMKIEIQGHVNWPTTYPYPITPQDIQLSEDRARTVYEYLITKGISPARMTFVGKGNTEMVIPDAATMEEYRKNMRVEILILER